MIGNGGRLIDVTLFNYFFDCASACALIALLRSPNLLLRCRSVYPMYCSLHLEAEALDHIYEKDNMIPSPPATPIGMLRALSRLRSSLQTKMAAVRRSEAYHFDNHTGK